MPHDDLDMTVGEPLRDLRTTLSCFDTASLDRLGRAFDEGRVITKKYVEENKGCLLYWLTDSAVTSKAELLAYDFGIVPDGLPAARRVVRYWDWGLLGAEAVQAEVKAALAIRHEIAAAEESADRAARRTSKAAVAR